MKLTPEQEEVVSITDGSHLVLAPPGSGKTEMLSQRILRALSSGVDPKRMLCATFTNRAAFEMRDRVEKECSCCDRQTVSRAADGGGEASRAVVRRAACGEVTLPDVGNLHHFCHRFLLSVHRLRPGTHVLDEVEQLDFIKEIVDVLRSELRGETSSSGGENSSSHGLSVAHSIDGISNDLRRKYLSDILEHHFAHCAKHQVSPYPDFLAGALVSHQSRIGIPFRYRSPMPPSMYFYSDEGVLRAIAIAYSRLKRKFQSVDFDDLVNETYLHLERNPLPDEKKFLWVQIDEVQDLNPLQWMIVKRLTAASAVSVYFGDIEQAIFSFLGASTYCFEDSVANCKRHYFKTNFRATPILLEVLMRYSISALASDWEFLPAPACRSTLAVPSCCSTLAVPSPILASRLSLAYLPPEGSIAAHVDHLLASVGAENVAILVRSNAEADIYESMVKPLGYRFAKVSGHDLFAYSPMRDFLAFVSLFIGATTRPGWANLFRRFSRGIRSRSAARYFVRSLFASGFDPMSLFDDEWLFSNLSLRHSRRSLFALRHLLQLKSLRNTLKPIFSDTPQSFRSLFESFSAVAFGDIRRYSLFELLPGIEITEEMLASPDSYPAAVAYAHERIERFLRYTDHIYSGDSRPFRQILAEDWDVLTKLKEADLLVGDEKIVISTIHKAKGRQFDAVIIPDVSSVLASANSEEREELRRLLYVAMSRAKRHLSLFSVNIDETSDSEVARVRKEIACISQCFSPGYIDYYTRRKIISNDWLFRWERLAAMNAARQCDLAFVSASLDSGNLPLMRMALKCLRHLPDHPERRRRFLEIIAMNSLDVLADSFIDQPTDSLTRQDFEKGDDLTACLPTVVDCLRDCEVYDHDAFSTVRAAALRSSSRVLARSVFRYMSSSLSRRSTLDDLSRSSTLAVFSCCRELVVPPVETVFPTPSLADGGGEASRAVLRRVACGEVASAIADFLYSRYGDLRFSAASTLYDLGDTRWLGNIVGTSRDFDYLASVPAPSHENTIRLILDNEIPETYEEHLRNILHARALRGN